MSEKLPAPREGLSGKAMRRVVMGSFAGALMGNGANLLI